jgi:glycosyltransferase involved in cell wall biosynthesis
MYRGLACTGPGVRKCIECSNDHYGRNKGGLIYLSNQAISKLERKLVDMFLAVSQVVAVNNGLVGSGLPYQVIPNFIPDVPELGRDNHNSLLDQLPGDGYLLYVGDLSVEKGIRVLLHAYSRLVNAPPLVLIGRRTGDTPNELPPGVLMMGSWPHSAVMQAWKRCSIAIVPSLWPEPFGMTVIEAMSAGRPLIASRIGGIADIVSHGESGLLVIPGDEENLQQAIGTLITSPEMGKHLGVAAAQRSREYKASNIVPRIEQLYQSIITKRNPC